MDDALINPTLLIDSIPVSAQTSVADSTWQTAATYAAHLGRQPAPTAKQTSRRITVVGGRGGMGRLFVQQFMTAGHHVNILEQDNWDQAESLLSNIDLVLVCVPIECTPTVIQNIAQYLAPTTALADITSIKAPIVQTMLLHHSGPVIGLHPMFGPKANSFQSQTIAVCSGRQDQAFDWLLKLFQQAGSKLVVCTPEEHDQMMVTIQSVRHFATLSLGIFLTNEAVDIQQSLKLASPSYRDLIDMIDRLLAQPAELVADIMLFTPERRESIVKLAETYNQLAQLALNNDRETLVRQLQTAQQGWAKINH
jgi:prephenate dehydrogenase